MPSAGAVTANGVAIATRDGATITDEATLTITATEAAEIVLVDVLA